jgi:hypothetical protein
MPPLMLLQLMLGLQAARSLRELLLLVAVL